MPSLILKETLGLVAKPHIAEKIMRIVHSVIGTLASLPQVGRSMTLHIDRDAAVKDISEFLELTRRLLKMNLSNEVKELIFVRDEGSRGRDADLLSIPDLICGAVSEVQNRRNGYPHIPSPKTDRIISWISETNTALKHLVLQYRLEIIEGVEHARWAELIFRESSSGQDEAL